MRQPGPEMTVVIPVHNRREFTRECLWALRAQTNRCFRVLVVDDGSTDGTAEMIGAEFPDVEILRGDGNLWWAGATNAGIRQALERGTGGAVLCLNDDTLPPPDFLAKLAASAAEHPGTLISACAVDAVTGAPVSGGERMNWLLAAPRRLPGTAQGAMVVDVTHAPGRGLLIPARVFERTGLFDAARFPQYAADYDFTLRARQAGFRVICDRRVVLRVFPEASGDASHRRRRSWLNFRKHLFDIRGGGNLRVFVSFALRHCPRTLLPVCLAVGLVRRLTGYPVRWLWSVVTGARKEEPLYAGGSKS